MLPPEDGQKFFITPPIISTSSYRPYNGLGTPKIARAITGGRNYVSYNAIPGPSSRNPTSGSNVSILENKTPLDSTPSKKLDTLPSTLSSGDDEASQEVTQESRESVERSRKCLRSYSCRYRHKGKTDTCHARLASYENLLKHVDMHLERSFPKHHDNEHEHQEEFQSIKLGRQCRWGSCRYTAQTLQDLKHHIYHDHLRGELKCFFKGCDEKIYRSVPYNGYTTTKTKTNGYTDDSALLSTRNVVIQHDAKEHPKPWLEATLRPTCKSRLSPTRPKPPPIDTNLIIPPYMLSTPPILPAPTARPKSATQLKSDVSSRSKNGDQDQAQNQNQNESQSQNGTDSRNQSSSSTTRQPSPSPDPLSLLPLPLRFPPVPASALPRHILQEKEDEAVSLGRSPSSSSSSFSGLTTRTQNHIPNSISHSKSSSSSSSSSNGTSEMMDLILPNRNDEEIPFWPKCGEAISYESTGTFSGSIFPSTVPEEDDEDSWERDKAGQLIIPSSTERDYKQLTVRKRGPARNGKMGLGRPRLGVSADYFEERRKDALRLAKKKEKRELGAEGGVKRKRSVDEDGDGRAGKENEMPDQGQVASDDVMVIDVDGRADSAQGQDIKDNKGIFRKLPLDTIRNAALRYSARKNKRSIGYEVWKEVIRFEGEGRYFEEL
ncbi:uncharacterized protein I303_101978 [Kwoniella dejecticola CBS 10117]|uniref:Uncharacterized protein n=1 Tax=Kwoniella dejecticola CBS 10117 TaxID=1296121 RepID=A0A1A6AC85_9TREE|nr:uncharacterized protein I303_01885 [Kwoniella dejecticola CBS 10117]OBR87677.1 hypothetical protein I303_01885 [Kwoniella dejecticola CBS 10117]